MADPPLLARLVRTLDRRTRAVGLKLDPHLPGHRGWSAPHALVVLAWVEPAAEGPPWEALEETWARLEAALEQTLLERADRRRYPDAYLLLALSAPPPDPEGEAFVRELELNTAICRKQVLWPVPGEGDSPWAFSLDRVTCLDLPPRIGPAPDPGYPDFPEKEARLVRDLEQRGTRGAVEHHAPSPLRDGEDRTVEGGDDAAG